MKTHTVTRVLQHMYVCIFARTKNMYMYICMKSNRETNSPKTPPIKNDGGKKKNTNLDFAPL